MRVSVIQRIIKEFSAVLKKSVSDDNIFKFLFSHVVSSVSYERLINQNISKPPCFTRRLLVSQVQKSKQSRAFLVKCSCLYIKKRAFFQFIVDILKEHLKLSFLKHRHTLDPEITCPILLLLPSYITSLFLLFSFLPFYLPYCQQIQSNVTQKIIPQQ